MSAADVAANESGNQVPTLQTDSIDVPAPDANIDPSAASDEKSEVEGPSEAHEGLLWMVTGESNPFQQRLMFTHNAVPILDLTLDPLLLRDLITSLAHVQEAQRAVLGVGVTTSEGIATSPSTPTDQPATGSHPAENENAAAADLNITSITEPDDADADGEPDTTHGEGTPQAVIGSGAFTTFAWWRTHKLLAFLLAFAVMAFILGTVTSPQ